MIQRKPNHQKLEKAVMQCHQLLVFMDFTSQLLDSKSLVIYIYLLYKAIDKSTGKGKVYRIFEFFTVVHHLSFQTQKSLVFPSYTVLQVLETHFTTTCATIQKRGGEGQ
mmetsp:Transcript_15055/g.19858  ORF Transcript_15055/g.19858 Transcript_15055/m.19858 type:complete len:109 (-) Transcript_15055:43-369(-)